MSEALHSPAAAADLLARHQRRIDLIAQCANENSTAEFERKWLSLVTRCAEWFSSVPLNPELYREPGGAFRCTIETAFYTMRLAGGQKFGATLSSERRRRVEPQYNYGVFLAAVCSWLDEPYRHFDVTCDAEVLAWNPSIHGPASAWLGNRPYRIARRVVPLSVERMRTAMLAQTLVGMDLLSELDAEVLSEVFGAINPNGSPVGAESLTHRVVRQAIATAADFDRKAQRAVFEPVQFSVPSAIHVAAELEPVVVSTPATAAAPSATAAPVSAESAGKMPAPTPASASAPPKADASGTSLLDLVSVPYQLGLLEDAERAGAEPAVAPSPKPIPSKATPDRSTAAEPPPEAFDVVLKGASRMIVDLFRALGQDVRAGKAKVRWSELGLVLSKQLVGSYGVSSDTLIDHMRRCNLLLANEPKEVTLAPRAGALIQERGA